MKFSKLIKKSYWIVIMHDAQGSGWLGCNGQWIVPLGVSVTGLDKGKSLYLKLTNGHNYSKCLDDMNELIWDGKVLSIISNSGKAVSVECEESESLNYLGVSSYFYDDCSIPYNLVLVASIAKFYNLPILSSTNARQGGLSKYSRGVVRFTVGNLVFYVQALIDV